MRRSAIPHAYTIYLHSTHTTYAFSSSAVSRRNIIFFFSPSMKYYYYLTRWFNQSTCHSDVHSWYRVQVYDIFHLNFIILENSQYLSINTYHCISSPLVHVLCEFVCFVEYSWCFIDRHMDGNDWTAGHGIWHNLFSFFFWCVSLSLSLSVNLFLSQFFP